MSIVEDADLGEQHDENQHHCDCELSNIQGSLEAIVTPPSDELETVELTKHQAGAVTAFNNLQKDHKEEVYAVADKEALEGFLDLTSGLVKRAANTFSAGVYVKFTNTSKALNHYAGMAAKLKARLEELRPLLKNRDFPVSDVFEYGAYARFFQCNGQGIGSFTQFQETLNNQVLATGYVFSSVESYSDVISEKLLTEITNLQSTRVPKGESIIALRDSIERYWLQTWKEANITPNHGQTPQSALQAYPDAKFVSLCPMFDNRYLLACQPKSNGGGDYSKAATAIKDYRAIVAYDKAKVNNPQAFMNIPNTVELLFAVDQCIRVLNDFKTLSVLAKKNSAYAEKFKRSTAILINHMNEVDDKQYFGYMGEYFKLMTAITTSTQEPYVAMAWMFIRTAMVVTTMVELSVFTDLGKHIVAKRFMTKQTEEFANMANEGYKDTQKALEAAIGSLKKK